MRGRILVVEDEEVMRELLRLHLSSAGYAVEVADDAIAAGYAVLKSPPDLIFLSSLAEGDDRARELGAVDYLRKPVRLEELLAAVGRHLAPPPSQPASRPLLPR